MDKAIAIKQWINQLLLLSALVLLSACGADTPEIGKWVSDSGQGSIEFKSNGDVIVIDNMNLEVTGSYNIEDNDSVLFRLKGKNIFDPKATPTNITYTIRANYEIKGDKLKLTVEEEGEVLDYRRY